MHNYTAVIRREGDWWIGWLQEIAGVNGQGKTREDCLDSIRSALKEALEMHRAEALATIGEPFEEVSVEP